MAKNANKTFFPPQRFFDGNLPILYQNRLNFHIMGLKVQKSAGKIVKNRKNRKMGSKVGKCSNKINFLVWRFFYKNLSSQYQNCPNFNLLGSKFQKSFRKLSKNQENDQIFTFSKFGRHLLHTIWSNGKSNFSLDSLNPPSGHSTFWVPHGIGFHTMTMIFLVSPIKHSALSSTRWEQKDSWA